MSGKGRTRKRRPAHIHVTVTEAVADWLRVRAMAEDRSVSDLVNRICESAREADRERYGDSERGEVDHV